MPLPRMRYIAEYWNFVYICICAYVYACFLKITGGHCFIAPTNHTKNKDGDSPCLSSILPNWNYFLFVFHYREVKFEMTDLPFAFCFHFLQPGSTKPTRSAQLVETLNCFIEWSAAGSRIDNWVWYFNSSTWDTEEVGSCEFEVSQAGLLRLETVSNKVKVSSRMNYCLKTPKLRLKVKRHGCVWVYSQTKVRWLPVWRQNRQHSKR